MANISGPDFITILVSDLKASYSFYKEEIGLPESAEIPIVEELREGPFGMTFSFQDPDGYVMTVHDGG